MGAAQLILIEGLTGSGKTATAMRVGDWLTSRGENARVFCEGAADHPIRTKAEDRLRAAADPRPSTVPGSPADGGAEGSPRAYAADQWRRLAERCLRPPHPFWCTCARPTSGITVTDPQRDWPETLARICAAVRPLAAELALRQPQGQAARFGMMTYFEPVACRP